MMIVPRDSTELVCPEMENDKLGATSSVIALTSMPPLDSCTRTTQRAFDQADDNVNFLGQEKTTASP
jgi:hypothetical protein